MLGGADPFAHFGAELVHGHAAEGGREDLLEIVHRELRHRLAIAGQHGLEGFDVLQFGFRGHDRRDPLQAVHHLRVHGMRDPRRAVLIEGGDARLRRHELRARCVGSRLHKRDDRMLRGAVVPRRQGIGLRQCLRAHHQRGNESEQAVDAFHHITLLSRSDAPLVGGEDQQRA